MIIVHQSKKWKAFNDGCILWRPTSAFTGPAVFGRPPPAQHSSTVAKTACPLNDRSANIVTQIDTVGLPCQSPLRLFEASHLWLGVGESKVHYWSWLACCKPVLGLSFSLLFPLRLSPFIPNYCKSLCCCFKRQCFKNNYTKFQEVKNYSRYHVS